MDNNLLANNPFAILTYIAAPAILTNATSVLAMSTINRMLRTRDRMHELFRESETKASDAEFIEQVNRVERQAGYLLKALHWIYVALGAFAGASLVTLLGALFGELGHELLIRSGIGAGLVLGFVGVAGIVGGCVNLLHATRLSLINISEEAEIIRSRVNKKTSDRSPA
ncbi:MAG TPA: DUF2721 domain-containing protein [Verrucomicrobiae bacterium]